MKNNLIIIGKELVRTGKELVRTCKEQERHVKISNENNPAKNSVKSV